MELTYTQELLMNGLDLFGVEKDAIVLILTALQKEKQMEELMQYMVNNRTATQEQILLKMVEISEK